jgi:hypothetical protein
MRQIFFYLIQTDNARLGNEMKNTVKIWDSKTSNFKVGYMYILGCSDKNQVSWSALQLFTVQKLESCMGKFNATFCVHGFFM